MNLKIGSLYMCNKIAAPNPWRDKVCLYLGSEEYEAEYRKKIYYYKFLREGKIVKASETFIKYMEKIG